MYGKRIMEISELKLGKLLKTNKGSVSNGDENIPKAGKLEDHAPLQTGPHLRQA